MAGYRREKDMLGDVLGFDSFDRTYMDVDGRITTCACNCSNNITAVASSLDTLDSTVRINSKGLTIDGSAVVTDNDLSKLKNDISMLVSTVENMQGAIGNLQKALVHDAGGGLRRSDLRTLRVG